MKNQNTPQSSFSRRKFLGLGALAVGASALGLRPAVGAENASAESAAAGATSRPKAAIPKKFRGMTPILPTTIFENGELDLESQRNLVRYCLDCGAVAIGHLAFASEFHKLTAQMRRDVIRTVVEEVNGRVPIFIGCAGASNRIAVDYAKEAQDLGADMVMACIPYVTVPDWPQARKYFCDVCNAVSVPVILQDIVPSANMLTAERIVQLSEENANLRHVKPEGNNFLEKTAKIFELAGDKIDVIGGYGGKHMIHMLRIGVTAFMTGTEAVDLHGAVVKAYLAGDEARAADIFYNKLMPYFMFYADHGEELLKWMLHRRGIIACPKALEPAAPARMSEIDMREFEWTLERIPFTPWSQGPIADLRN